MLKFYLKKDRLNFTKGWRSEAEETDTVDDKAEIELLRAVFRDGFEIGLDSVIHSMESY